MPAITISNTGNLLKIVFPGNKVRYFDTLKFISNLTLDSGTLIVSSTYELEGVFTTHLSDININGVVLTTATSFETAVRSLIFGYAKLEPYAAIAFMSSAPGAPIRRVTSLGNNPDVDIASLPEDVWTVGGAYPFPTVATSFEVVSTSASDTSAGIGARTIRILGLDANYDEVAENVTMNGTTAVPVVTQMLRINDVLVLTAGSNEVNVGTININRSPGGITQAQISAAIGFSRQSIRTVPAGHTLQILSSLFAITRAGGVDKTVTISNFFRTSTGVRRAPFEIGISQSFPYRHDGEPGIPIAEKTDVGFRVVDSSVSDVSVTAAFLGILMRNDLIAALAYP